MAMRSRDVEHEHVPNSPNRAGIGARLDAKMEKLRADFAAEVAALRRELAESHEMLEHFRTLLAFAPVRARQRRDQLNRLGGERSDGLRANPSDNSLTSVPFL